MTSALPAPSDGAQRVFILGGTTSIGRDLARRLVAAGHAVTATCATARDAASLRADGVTPAYPDLSRAGELRSVMTGITVVINLLPQIANLPPQLGTAFDPDLARQAAAVAAAAQQVGAAFVVHTSYAFLDGHAHGEDADDLLEPAEPILAAARAAERAALSGTVPACVLRFGYIYGAGVPELDTLAAELKAGRYVPLGEDHARAAWLHQADAAAAILAALTTRPAGHTITVASGSSATPAAFLRYFASAQGLTPGAGLRLPLLSRGVPAAHKALMLLDYAGGADTSALDWTPRYTSYQHGLDDVLLSWRAVELVGTGTGA